MAATGYRSSNKDLVVLPEATFTLFYGVLIKDLSLVQVA